LFLAPSCLEGKREADVLVILREFNQEEKITLTVAEVFAHPNWSSFNNDHESNAAIIITKSKVPFKFFIFTSCLRQFLVRNNVNIPRILEKNPCDKIDETAKNLRFVEIPFTSSKSGVLYGQFKGHWFLFGFTSEEVIEAKVCDEKTFNSFKEIIYFFHCKDHSLTTAKGLKASEKYCAKDTIFFEEFKTLDKQIWKHENTLAGGGSWEFQWYVPDTENSFIRDEILHIKPTLTTDKLGQNFVTKSNADIPLKDCTDTSNYGCSRSSRYGTINPIRSASISTVNSFSFKYGTIEIRAKIATGDWLKSAISLLPKDAEFYGKWPQSGQIDLLEARGNRNLSLDDRNIGVERIGCTFHFAPSWEISHSDINSFDGFNNDFHVYKLVWTPEEMTTFVDDKEVHYLKINDDGLSTQFGLDANPWTKGNPNAPFDKEFYISISLRAGGISYFPEDAKNPDKKPWHNNKGHAATDFWKSKERWISTWNYGKNSDSHFQIDYIKVTAL
jgi:beta-glucanase (GH16 family)